MKKALPSLAQNIIWLEIDKSSLTSIKSLLCIIDSSFDYVED